MHDGPSNHFYDSFNFLVMHERNKNADIIQFLVFQIWLIMTYYKIIILRIL